MNDHWGWCIIGFNVVKTIINYPFREWFAPSIKKGDLGDAA